jgi:hypothetical protein
MWVMGRGSRALLLCAVTALAAVSGAAAVAPDASVTCADSSASRVRGATVLLDSVVLPRPAALARSPRAVRHGPYRWFRSARIAIRSGEQDVDVSVPLGWRHLVAISWGRATPANSVRFGRCSAARGWVVFEGGFHLRRQGDCVPVVVRAGGTSTTVRLGVGRACGAKS